MAALMIAVSFAATDDPQTTVVSKGCSPVPAYTYVNATAFYENLNYVFASLLPNLSKNGFAFSGTDKAGKTDPVYGLAVCRRYLSANECSECFTEAATQLKATCTQSSGGRIHLDGCFLRYENSSSFYGESLGAGTSYCLSSNDSDPQAFSQRAEDLSTQLILNASANNNYAVGSIDDSLYGLAQCWPPLTSPRCQRCLTGAKNLLLTCIPRLEGRGLEAGCFLRYSTYSFFTHNQTSSSTNWTPSSGKSSSKIVPIILGSTGGTALILVLCFLFCQRNRHPKRYDRTAGDFEQVIFNYELMRDVTGNFDRKHMLGRGGFGEVYQGRLPDGRDVAVKKLNGRQTSQAEEEFLTEVKLLTSVRHRNLVRLLGCCTRGHDRLLVYEFMANNSVHKHLFGEIRNPLSWEIRLNIIMGTARGLAYLHEDSNARIIHRDIKCGNILLDDIFHPKIADFGMARFFPEGETHVSTRVGGTRGYTAPEYAVHGLLSEKADVYSYGIVVLEIVSGRQSVDESLPAPMQLLLELVWNEYEHDKVLDIVDSKLEGQYPAEQALRVITIALLCTQGSSGMRPTMSQVLWMLNNDSEIDVLPTQPAFIDVTSDSRANSSATSKLTTSDSRGSHESRGSATVTLNADQI
eukprot:PITA_03137